MENDFEPPLRTTHPVLRHIKERLLEEGAQAAMLSGSGATVFGVFRDEQTAARCSTQWTEHAEWTVSMAPSPSMQPLSLSCG
jgi:4-diphosphocytidyl-2-C-methyl-D-erythritol kinase